MGNMLVLLRVVMLWDRSHVCWIYYFNLLIINHISLENCYATHDRTSHIILCYLKPYDCCISKDSAWAPHFLFDWLRAYRLTTCITAHVYYQSIVHMCVTVVKVKVLPGVWASPVCCSYPWSSSSVHALTYLGLDVFWSPCLTMRMLECNWPAKISRHCAQPCITKRWHHILYRMSRFPRIIRTYHDLTLNMNCLVTFL